VCECGPSHVSVCSSVHECSTAETDEEMDHCAPCGVSRSGSFPAGKEAGHRCGSDLEMPLKYAKPHAPIGFFLLNSGVWSSFPTTKGGRTYTKTSKQTKHVKQLMTGIDKPSICAVSRAERRTVLRTLPRQNTGTHNVYTIVLCSNERLE
jgi:hypothetical protein